MAPKRDPANPTNQPSDKNTKASVKGKNTVASDKKNLTEASSNKKEFKVATKNKSEKKKKKKGWEYTKLGCYLYFYFQ